MGSESDWTEEREKDYDSGLLDESSVMVFENLAVRDSHGEKVPGTKLIKVKDLRTQVIN